MPEQPIHVQGNETLDNIRAGLIYVREFYRTYINTMRLNVGVTAGLTILLLVVRNNLWESIPLVALNTVHIWLLKVTKDEELSKVDYWMQKSRRYSWLMNSIRELIHRKTQAYRDSSPLPGSFRVDSVWKNLQMLYQFYSHYDEKGEPLGVRVSFFMPSDDGEFLSVRFYFYADGQQPHFLGNPGKERLLFSKGSGDSLVVKAWESKQTQVFESPDEIQYHHDGQKKTIKSMIAYPLDGRDSADTVGVICVCIDKPGFFKRSDIETHNECIGEFGLRIELELTRLSQAAANG